VRLQKIKRESLPRFGLLNDLAVQRVDDETVQARDRRVAHRGRDAKTGSVGNVGMPKQKLDELTGKAFSRNIGHLIE
jgi:hypothetical protein